MPVIKQILSDAGIDVGRADECLGGNYELFLKLIKSFLSDDDFSNLSKAFENAEQKDIETFAHSLKGVSGNLGITKMYKDLSDIVSVVRGQSEGDIKALLSDVEYEKNRLETVINEKI